MTAILRPVFCCGATNLRLFAIAYSPRKCSTELMPTWSSTSLRLQPVSQGAGTDATHHRRERVRLGEAPPRILLPCDARRRLLDPADDVEIAANVLAGRATALTWRRRLDVGRALVRPARLENLLAPRIPFGVAVGVAPEREFLNNRAWGCGHRRSLRGCLRAQCFAPSLIAVLTSWCTPPTMPILKP